MISTRAKVQAYDSHPLAHTFKDGLRVADSGSIPQMGIALAAGSGHIADANRRWELLGLPAAGAGFRTFPQEFAAVLRR